MKNKNNFQIMWVDQPNGLFKLKKYSRQEYVCQCFTEKTSKPFRDWVEYKKETMPKGMEGIFIYDILPTTPLERSKNENIIQETQYLIRCSWIKPHKNIKNEK